MKIIMVAGTASGVGKHTVTCGLIRFLKNHGSNPIPFKAIAIEKFPIRARSAVTPSICVQAIAAKIRPVPELNPVRIVYSSKQMTPSLRLSGIGSSPLSLLQNRSAIRSHILSALETSKQHGDVLVWEGTGGLSDWAGPTLGAELVEYLRPVIILVSDALNGGALAAVLGTLELIPNTWRRSLVAVVFNNMGLTPSDPPVSCWAANLRENHGINLVLCMPRCHDLSIMSEDRWPLGRPANVEDRISHVFATFQTALSAAGDCGNLLNMLLGK